MSELEHELLRFTGEASVKAALKALRIATEEDVYQGLSLVSDWKPGGAETHVLVFDVGLSGRTCRLIMKACTPFALTSPIQDTLARWLARRAALEQHNVRVPRLYGVSSGTLLEDYIPHALGELPSSAWTRQIVEEVMHFASVLANLGFHAVAPFLDLRTEGAHVYAVDFGEDLGDPSTLRPAPDYCAQSRQWIRLAGGGNVLDGPGTLADDTG